MTDNQKAPISLGIFSGAAMIILLIILAYVAWGCTYSECIVLETTCRDNKVMICSPEEEWVVSVDCSAAVNLYDGGTTDLECCMDGEEHRCLPECEEEN